MQQTTNITETKVYRKGDNQARSNCKSILFVNTGFAPVQVQQKMLYQGDFWQISQDNGYIDETVYDISFQSSTLYDSMVNGYALTVSRIK